MRPLADFFDEGITRIVIEKGSYAGVKVTVCRGDACTVVDNWDGHTGTEVQEVIAMLEGK